MNRFGHRRLKVLREVILSSLLDAQTVYIPMTPYKSRMSQIVPQSLGVFLFLLRARAIQPSSPSHLLHFALNVSLMRPGRWERRGQNDYVHNTLGTHGAVKMNQGGLVRVHILGLNPGVESSNGFAEATARTSHMCSLVTQRCPTNG